MLRVAIYLCLIAIALGLKLRPGSCPPIPKQKLDLSRFLGKWITYERSYHGADMSSKCQRFEIMPPKPNVTDIVFSDFSTVLNKPTTVRVEAQLIDNVATAEMHIPGFGITELEFRVLETDFVNYGIIVGCQEYGNFHLLQAYFNTRVAEPKLNATKIIDKAFQKAGIKPLRMIKVDQSNCPETNC